MVLIAKKQIEQTVLINDVENVSILGLDQGCVLLFSAISSNVARNSTTPRTVIGGVQLNDGEQKIYHRHPSCVKITHASINAARSLCCFVTRTESYNFDVFVAEIGSPNSGRLFSLKFSRSSPIRAYLAPHDVILLLYRDTVTVFRMPSSGNATDKSVAVDRDAQLSECIYYQWDTLQQRLHIIQKRPPVLIKTVLTSGYEAFIYTAYTINARGQFDSIMKIDFDLKVPPSTSGTTSTSNFEILSNDTSLYLCWQLIMKEETDKVEYAVISLGHGRSLHISKSLNKGNWEIFQSRKVHFGLLDGDYVFAILRGEFVHLLNFNVQLNFLNHLFFPNDSINLPYDTKYTTQRGLVNKVPTLLYEKKNLFTYTIEICPNELIKSISSTTIQSIIAYALVASKDNNILQQILEKILFDMYDDLNTKTYLMEILTALIFVRLSKRYHNNKYVLVFPATTVNSRHTNDTDVSVRPIVHHREYQPEHSGTTNLDQDYHEKLRISFYHSRKYRHKLSYYHPIMSSLDEPELIGNLKSDFDPKRRQSAGLSPPPSLPRERSSSPGLFNFPKKRESASAIPDPNKNDNQRSFILLVPRNEYLFQNVSYELGQLHAEWGQERIKDIAYEYVQTTQVQCDYLIKLFTRLAEYDRAQPLMDDDPKPPSEKYKTLLVVIEKLYLAMVELGFSPTDDLQRTLIGVSFRVMPFDRFVAAIDQNTLTLTQEFVQQVISDLDDDDPKSYPIKEQLILMLPNSSPDLHSSLFDSIGNNRAKRMSAQLHVARSFPTDKRNRNTAIYDAGDTSDEIQVDEIVNVNNNQNGINTHSRLVEQAAVTFYRDCFQRRILDKDELRTVKAGLLTLASSAP